MAERAEGSLAEGEEVEIELAGPVQGQRQGEERFESLLRLEQMQRRDSMLAEARALLKQLEGTAVGEIVKDKAGRAAKQRRLKQMQLIEQLGAQTFKRPNGRWEGPLVPATVMNLNPVPMTLQGQLQRWTVPPAGQGACTANLKFRGRVYPASYLTFRSPEMWFVPIDTNHETGSPVMDVKYIPPLGLAHQFYEHYVSGASDAQGMGGVLMFEGFPDEELHPVKNKKSGAVEPLNLWVPERHVTLGGLGDVIYRSSQKTMEECILPALQMQRAYAETMIAEGHRYATSQNEIERSNLTYLHKRWHNWALDRGYLEEAQSWASERLKDTPSRTAVYCPHCRTKQADEEQFFCPECNAPFDTVKAYLAGKPVPMEYLEAIDDEEDMKKIVEEAKRRAARRAILSGAGAALEDAGKKGKG